MDGVQLRDLVKFLFTMIKTTQQAWMDGATSLDGWIGRPGNPLGDAHLTLTGVTDVTKYDY